MIKRYDPCRGEVAQGEADMEETAYGDYVAVQDFLNLQVTARQLAAALESLLAEADAYASLMPRCEEGSPSFRADVALAAYRELEQ